MANNENQDATRPPETGIENFELQYLQDMSGATREQVRAAIEAVGNDRARIMEYLRTNYITFHNKPR